MPVYTTSRETPKPMTSLKSDIMSILFLSKCLNGAESRYWPTELEVVGLVWTIRKIRHMIDNSPRATIVYTDHSATAGIAKERLLLSRGVGISRLSRRGRLRSK